MPNEREEIFQPLTYIDYDIAGNEFRAYFDADKKLVFVLDFVVSDIKPNVLLVINPVGGRKWDDILMNDYGVDLETIRPKKDNKYQKLDIEYSGLAQYDDLIAASENDGDVDAAAVRLDLFRMEAARRAAFERLGAAEMTAERTRETIEKTNDAIAEHQAKVKELKAKLAEQRSNVGREPTKQSAAKILRTESKIDAMNDKLGRAKKRLGNAQHRLVVAEEDAEIAREILYKIDDMIGDMGEYPESSDFDVKLPAKPIVADMVVPEPVPVPMKSEPKSTEITTYEEPKADDMADDEVKPLFDEDPDILDEEIAFKPIDFGNIGSLPVEETPLIVSEPIAEQPLSFEPPVLPSETLPVVEEEEEDVYVPQPVPMLDSLTPVALPSEKIDSELMGGIDVGQTALPQSPVQPLSELSSNDVVSMPSAYPVEAPVLPSEMQAAAYTSVPSSMPEISPAPVGDVQRPVSPITGAGIVGTLDSTDVATARRKPNVLYYVLLVVLIALSIFTLWIYQKSANDVLPELGANTAAVVEAVEENVQVVEPAKVEVQDVIEEVQPEPDLLQVVEPEPVPVEPAQPIEMPSESEAVDVPVSPEPDLIETPYFVQEEEPKPVIPTEEEILAKKPSYNVSQNEKMFVADPKYETDEVAEDVVEEVIEEIDRYVEPVSYTEPQIVQTSVLEPEYVDTQLVVSEDVEACADGAMPDSYGCCAGEEYVEFGGGEVACCIVGTDECFPPML